jgi:hypothetical protein
VATKQKDKEATEDERVDKWRRDKFRAMLPEEISDTIVEQLVVSDSSPHDLQFLLGKGCNPLTAVKILV